MSSTTEKLKSLISPLLNQAGEELELRIVDGSNSKTDVANLSVCIGALTTNVESFVKAVAELEQELTKVN